MIQVLLQLILKIVRLYYLITAFAIICQCVLISTPDNQCLDHADRLVYIYLKHCPVQSCVPKFVFKFQVLLMSKNEFKGAKRFAIDKPV